MVRSLRYLIPLLVFVGLAALLYRGLGMDPKLVPSPLVGKPAPNFILTRLDDARATITDADLRGRVTLLNVWATWCVSCRAEHGVLMELGRSGKARIVGLNYKDERAAALQWLQRYGDPYEVNAFDGDGRVGIDWGVYGTPETFVIDKQGVIRYKHVGPLNWDVLSQRILPLIAALESA